MAPSAAVVSWAAETRRQPSGTDASSTARNTTAPEAELTRTSLLFSIPAEVRVAALARTTGMDESRVR